MEKINLNKEDALLHASPVLTDVVHKLIEEIYDGKLTFTLFLSDGEKSGLSGNHNLDCTFKAIREIEELHKKNECKYVHTGDATHRKH